MAHTFVRTLTRAVRTAAFAAGFVITVSPAHAGDRVPLVSEYSFLHERFSLQADIDPAMMAQPRKSPFRAAVYSLILPGAGEYYAGNFSTGRYLFGAETTLWLTVLGLHSYGNWIRDDARAFAAVYAGVNWSGKDDDFFVNIGNFMTRQEYNEKKMRDRDIGAIYTDASFDWQWESHDKRREYRDMRVRSDQMLNSIRFVGAAIIANHIISAVIAGNSAARYNERAGAMELHSRWSFGFAPVANGFVAGFQHTF
jgi:hypothetical protein